MDLRVEQKICNQKTNRKKQGKLLEVGLGIHFLAMSPKV